MIRGLLASVCGRPLDELPGDAPLFGPDIALDSLAGAELLERIRAATGVDVAALDLGLECLQTIATLERFVADRQRDRVEVAPSD